MDSPNDASPSGAAIDIGANLGAGSEAATPDTAPVTSAKPPSNTSDATAETRRCFVCLMDEDETAIPKDWCTPCRCSLEGHHECLLDWVADLESRQKAVTCPQCKAKIVVDDRWDPAIHLSDRVMEIMSQYSPAILLLFLGSGTLVGSSYYGLEAIRIFAGPEVMRDFLIRQEPVSTLPDVVQRNFPQLVAWSIKRFPYLAVQHYPELKVGNLFLLSLVGPALLVQRLNADSLVVPPSILIVMWSFIVGPTRDYALTAMGGEMTWPPSFEHAILLVPTIKSIYSSLYRRFIGPIEARLDAKTKRSTLNENPEPLDDREDPDQEGAAPVPNPPPEADHVVDFELELNLGAWNNNGEEAEEERLEGQEYANDGEGAAQAGAEDGDEGNGGNVINENGRRRGGGGRQQRGALELSDRSPFNWLAGTLLFPGVCYGAGEVLRWVLPRRFVTKTGAAATGLLQEQWGRSLVGGCLFVLLKDAFALYVKYRRAENRPHRRIRNVDRRKR